MTEATTTTDKKVDLPKGITQDVYVEVKRIMKSGFENKAKPDDIKSAIFSTGAVPFSVLNRLYNLVGKEEGLIVNIKEVHAALRVELGKFTITFNETYDELAAIASRMAEGVKGGDKAKAISVLKKMFKDSDKKFPKKPITAGSKMGVVFRTLIDIFANQPQATEEECIDRLKLVVKKEENAVNYGKMYHKVLYAAANGLTADEVLAELYKED